VADANAGSSTPDYRLYSRGSGIDSAVSPPVRYIRHNNSTDYFRHIEYNIRGLGLTQDSLPYVRFKGEFWEKETPIISEWGENELITPDRNNIVSDRDRPGVTLAWTPTATEEPTRWFEEYSSGRTFSGRAPGWCSIDEDYWKSEFKAVDLPYLWAATIGTQANITEFHGNPLDIVSIVNFGSCTIIACKQGEPDDDSVISDSWKRSRRKGVELYYSGFHPNSDYTDKPTEAGSFVRLGL
jgi:hypothetical protein